MFDDDPLDVSFNDDDHFSKEATKCIYLLDDERVLLCNELEQILCPL